jgi:hypothetical protein
LQESVPAVIVRRFLVAPAIARLLRAGLAPAQVTEGYFNPSTGRQVYVRAEDGEYRLVLKASGPPGAAEEEAVGLERAYAEALIEASTGTVRYDRVAIDLDAGRTAVLDSFTVPGTVHMVAVAFPDQAQADAFDPPLWFSSDVTDCDNQTIAVNRLSVVEDIPLTGAALEAALDALEHQELRSLLGRDETATPPSPPPSHAEELRDLHARMVGALAPDLDPVARDGNDRRALLAS